MPRTDVFFYQEDPEDVPVLDWLKQLRHSNQRAYESCVAAIARLGEVGHELRRPLADILRNGIYELRVKKGRVNFRILYFFHGRNLAILGHALTKEDKVPKADIERAIRRKKTFEADPAAHSYVAQEEG
ncbi:MAG TPA: type II toxin-antitoxin system RelE/ParE family toxin [Bryobacteraceae bacterium]|nr:type II toxin-antitoxin system RelE/ParE family toxin [Bryobacteraceae bacterium]